jgi:hypothetical protein
MYQKRILPSILLFPTYLPQASSLLERYGLTDKILHPLFPKFFFFPLSARGPTRRRDSTGLAELWGGWPIEAVISLENTQIHRYALVPAGTFIFRCWSLFSDCV